MAVTSCARVVIKDAEWCGDVGTGAICFFTLSTGSREINEEEWDVERVGQVCTKSDNFANWKSAIEQLCHETKLCSYEDQKKIDEFFNRVEHVR